MVREIGVQDLLDVVTLPYVVHHVDPARARRAWLHGRAVVIDSARARAAEGRPGSNYSCLGTPEDLETLMSHLVESAPRPWRVSVEQPARPPASWVLSSTVQWHWMTTSNRVPAGARWRVETLDGVRDAVEIDELMDAASSGSFARPGQPGVEVWMGIREMARHASRLLAAGALQRMHDRTLHVRGVSVLPETRGAGAGRALSAALTNYALAHGSAVATLGVYTDNDVAVRMYESMGYRIVHTFRSGDVAP